MPHEWVEWDPPPDFPDKKMDVIRWKCQNCSKIIAYPMAKPRIPKPDDYVWGYKSPASDHFKLTCEEYIVFRLSVS